jgi:hypothetical protein
MKVEDAVKVDPVGEFELKGIRRRWRRTMWLPRSRNAYLFGTLARCLR